MTGVQTCALPICDCSELLMGHVDSLGNVYRDYSDKDLASMYLKGIPDISVFESSPDLSGINEELKNKDKQIQELKDQMQMLMAKVLTNDDKEKKD